MTNSHLKRILSRLNNCLGNFFVGILEHIDRTCVELFINDIENLIKREVLTE